jgi:NAD(P)-dependent dehydrogenase (short-subunit alcohol dehydrogenase family)
MICGHLCYLCKKQHRWAQSEEYAILSLILRNPTSIPHYYQRPQTHLYTMNSKITTFSKISTIPLALCFAVIALWSSTAEVKAEPLTVLVTGANRGLGLEHAKQYRAAGHTVIGTARKPELATKLKATGAQVVKLDITNDEDIANLAKTLKGKKIDILLNNAGYMARGEVTRESLSRCFDVNTAGPLLLAKALVPNLKLSKNPRIVNISSRLGIISKARGIYPAYSISKAALNMATKHLHGKLSKEGIIVISMGPGHNQTDMGGKGAPLKPQESVAKMMKLIGSLKKTQSGRFWYYDGTELPW